jgi:hypothetical protein
MRSSGVESGEAKSIDERDRVVAVVGAEQK